MGLLIFAVNSLSKLVIGAPLAALISKVFYKLFKCDVAYISVLKATLLISVWCIIGDCLLLGNTAGARIGLVFNYHNVALSLIVLAVEYAFSIYALGYYARTRDGANVSAVRAWSVVNAWLLLTLITFAAGLAGNINLFTWR